MYDVSMSAVKSVSGFAIDVLKFEPLFTVNHWPFLCFKISFCINQDNEDIVTSAQLIFASSDQQEFSLLPSMSL